MTRRMCSLRPENRDIENAARSNIRVAETRPVEFRVVSTPQDFERYVYDVIRLYGPISIIGLLLDPRYFCPTVPPSSEELIAIKDQLWDSLKRLMAGGKVRLNKTGKYELVKESTYSAPRPNWVAEVSVTQSLHTGGNIDGKTRVDRSPEEKWQIVQEAIKTDNVSETCRRHGIATSLFYRWKDEAEQGAKAALGERNAAAAETESDDGIRPLERTPGGSAAGARITRISAATH